MKQLITIFSLLLITTCTSAQVGIGTKTPDESSILEVFAGDDTIKKGFLPPRVTTLQRDAIASPPAGLVIYNTTDNRLEFSNGTSWISFIDGSIVTAINGAANTSSGGVAIGTSTPNPAAIVEVLSSTKGFLPPRLTSPERNDISSPATGLTIYNTTVNCLQFYNGAGWVNVCDGTITLPPPPPPLEGNIVLTAGQVHFVYPVFDNDYHPYMAPTGPANQTHLASDGTADPVLNRQGILTTTGAIIIIPYTVTTAPVNLAAFSSTVNVPAFLTEDGISRDVTLSYAAQTLAVGSGFINATLQAVTGDLNVFKLDLINGLGDGSDTVLVTSAVPTTRNVLGLLIANFIIAVDNVGNTGEIQLRASTCQNDVSVGTTPIVAMMYDFDGNGTAEYCWCAREVDQAREDAAHPSDPAPLSGKTWLDRNLGAYRYPVSTVDEAGYGDLYQWGRKMDGHQKRYQRTNDLNEGGSGSGTIETVGSGVAGAFANGITGVKADNPTNSLFINLPDDSNAVNRDWRINFDGTLWDANGVNNPCPKGYYVPLRAVFDVLNSWVNNIPASGNRIQRAFMQTELNFVLSGQRRGSDGSRRLVGQQSVHYTSTVENSTFFSVNTYNVANGNFAILTPVGPKQGYAVRCIRD